MKYASSLSPAIEAAADALTPPKRLPLDEWANEHLRLSGEGSAQPGRWTCLPFQREPLAAMAPHSQYEQVALVWASQTGKTSLMLAFLAYIIAEDPAPCLVVQPDLNVAYAFSVDRIAPLVRDTPALAGKVSDPKARDSGSTIFHRRFVGGHVTIVGANSPAGLASRPIRYLVLDEVDRFQASAGSEGAPTSLAIARTRTFWNRKIIWASSPTTKDASEIESVFLESDQREYEVPCPLCGAFQLLLWPRIEWPDGAPESAFCRCESCGGVIEHHHKTAMVAKGHWTAAKPGAKIAGFHLSELYSPFRTWGELAIDWLKAQGNPEKLRAWINTTAAEWWDDEKQTSTDEASLLARREIFSADVPVGAVLLTAGIDVQDNRVECEVVGWAVDETSWSVDHRVFMGDPSGPAVWAEVDRYLLQPWIHESRVQLRIASACVDSGGHHTQSVYRFCTERLGRQVFAIKGQAGSYPVWPKKPTRNTLLSTPLWMIGVDSAKALVLGRLRVDDPAAPGYCHFPIARSEAFFSQLLSEYVKTGYRRGAPYRFWVRKHGRAAEALDCRVYATAALEALKSMGVRLDRTAQQLAAIAPVDAPATLMQINNEPPPRRPGPPRVIGRFRR